MAAEMCLQEQLGRLGFHEPVDSCISWMLVEDALETGVWWELPYWLHEVYFQAKCVEECGING